MTSHTTPDSRRRTDARAAIGGLAVVTIAAVALVLVQAIGPVRDPAGVPLGPIAPALWASGALLLVSIFTGVRLAIDLVGRRIGWGIRLAIANSLLGLLFVAPTIWLAFSGRLLDDAFFVAVGWPAGATTTAWGVIVVSAWISLQDVTHGFLRAARR